MNEADGVEPRFPIDASPEHGSHAVARPAPRGLWPFVAWSGARCIDVLIALLGRRVEPGEVPWLVGPTGGDFIGDLPYEECARNEGLELVRRSTEGGLIPRFDALSSTGFDAARVSDQVRDFYENTARYRMDVWARTWFPASLGLRLLVLALSRKVDQLNFPLDTLTTALGMDSEIVLLRRADGTTKYTGWCRRLRADGRVLYTGFYMTERVPRREGRSVKVVFPMPGGNATVILRPELAEDGSFVLTTDGCGFGDAGFYRVKVRRDRALQVWHVRTLREQFRLHADGDGVLRCDHRVRFLWLRVLDLHYRITPV